MDFKKYIEDIIAVEYIKGDLKENTEYKLVVKDNKIYIKKEYIG